MLSFIATILIKAFLLAGIGFLLGMIVRLALMTGKYLLTKIREKLGAKVGYKVFVGEVSKIAKAVNKEAEKNGTVAKVDDLLRELDGEGVIIADINEKGDVIQDSIQIEKAERVDDDYRRILDRYDGEIILTA